MPQSSDQLNLGRVVFYGRSLAEYQLFFNFDISDFRGRTILDCPGGTASFAKEAEEQGVRVVAVDPVYIQPWQEIERVARADIEHTLAEVRRVQHVYTWDFYPDWETMRRARFSIFDRFIGHYRAPAVGSYAAAALPGLPFRDRQFDLVLSGHLLFIYKEFFDFEFHVAAIRELVRVSRGEVRLFPVAGMDRQPYPDLARLQTALQQAGIVTRVEKSRHEFARGWNQLLIAARA